MDNLNTHKARNVINEFGDDGSKMLSRILWHYTPKHASWLNIAETEINVMDTECTKRRFQSYEHLEREVKAWEKRRNQARSKIKWGFTREKADVKLSKYYTVLLNGYNTSCKLLYIQYTLTIRRLYMNNTTIQISSATRDILNGLKSNKRMTYDQLLNALISLIPEGDDEGQFNEDFRASLLRSLLDIKERRTYSTEEVKKRLGIE